MEHFLGFAIPGIPFGCTYALVAVGIVLTYQATGVLNFAYGAQAYLSAFVFTYLVQNEHLPVGLAFVIAVVVLAPAVGLVFDRFLFRKIAPANVIAKLVTGISMLIGIPAVLSILFTNSNQYNPPSILFNPDVVYFRVAGTPINGISVTCVLATAVTLVALVVLIRWTSLGLKMRGAVESRRLIELDGVNGGRVVASAWAVSGLIAGLAGVLLAPAYGQLQFSDYADLMVAAFAAAAWAVLRSLPIAVLVGVLMGITVNLLQGYLPAGSIWSSAALTSLPFIVLVGALVLVPGMRTLGGAKDPLACVDPPTPPSIAALRAPEFDRVIRILWYVLLVVFSVSMLTWMPKIWENVFNAGLAYSVVFLSITLITGMGGQLSLCQATLAGVGAFMAAQLASHLGLNFLLGGLVGAAAAALVAVVLAFASVRLRGLGLALMTIAAALVFDNVVFAEVDTVHGQPINVTPTRWVSASSTRTAGPSSSWPWWCWPCASSWCCGCGAGSIGRFLGAMQGSSTAASGIGVNLTWMHVLVFGLSGAVAGIGGTLLSINQQAVNPNTFSWEFSLVFVVVVVTTGVNTPEGAIQAGFGYVVLQQLLTYVPGRLGRQQPADHLLRLRGPHLRGPPRGDPGVPEAAVDPAVRAIPPPGPRRTEVGGTPGSRRRYAGAGRRSARGGRLTWRRAGDVTAAGERRLQDVRRDRRGQRRVDRGRAGGERGPGRPQRRRQDHPVQLRLRSAATRARPDRARRPVPGRHADVRAGPAGDRADLPAGRGLPRHDRARPPAGRPAGPVAQGPAVAGPVQPVQADGRGDGQGRRVLAMVGLEDRAEAPVASLGLGSCRLVELARALVADPVVLWPTSRRRASTSTRPGSWARCSARSSATRGWPWCWSSTTCPWWPRWSTGPW